MSAGSQSLWFLNPFRAYRLSGLLLSVVLLAFASSRWSFVCPPECLLPSCQCPSSSVASISGKPPQFVIITVDDALGDVAYDLTEQVSAFDFVLGVHTEISENTDLVAAVSYAKSESELLTVSGEFEIFSSTVGI